MFDSAFLVFSSSNALPSKPCMQGGREAGGRMENRTSTPHLPECILTVPFSGPYGNRKVMVLHIFGASESVRVPGVISKMPPREFG